MSDLVAVFGQQGTVAIFVALIGLIGSFTVYLSTRGKTRTDAKIALDKRIDERVTQQLSSAYERLDKLDTELKEEREHSRKQDQVLRSLEARERAKSDIFRRIFATLAELVHVRPQLELTTTELELVGDTLPPDWVKRSGRPPTQS